MMGTTRGVHAKKRRPSLLALLLRGCALLLLRVRAVCVTARRRAAPRRVRARRFSARKRARESASLAW
jgi:hypothetical protein